MPRPRPFARARLAWLLSGLMLAAVAGDWRGARRYALDVLALLQGVIDGQARREDRNTSGGPEGGSEDV